MAAIRSDFLKECMSDVGQAPLDEFNRAFCVRCQNPECVRSGGNHSLFNKRVSGWREAMFDRVPRAADDDPRYAQIRAKRFLPIGEPRPHATVSTAKPPVISAEKMPAPRAPEPVPDPSVPEVGASVTVEEPQPQPQPQPVVRPAIRPATDVQNTPFIQGTVLKGGDPVEKPGSTFTFDDE